MSKKNKKSLVFQVSESLKRKMAIGRSKKEDKRLGVSHKYIYSWETFHSYQKEMCYFVKWCKSNHKVKTLEDCKPFADEWLQSRAGLSGYTQKLDVSALKKLYDNNIELTFQAKETKRVDITRSRGAKIRDSHFSEEKNADLVAFCRSTGLRRAELEALTGNQLEFIKGNPYIRVDRASKGGKVRYAPIVGEQKLVIERMKRAGSGKVWGKVSSNADIHSYRADYAKKVYSMYARNPREIPQNERYMCRADKAGTWYDKRAMLVASKALGHNRLNVIAEHYLY